MTDKKNKIEQIICRACDEKDCEYGHCYLKLGVLENILSVLDEQTVKDIVIPNRRERLLNALDEWCEDGSPKDEIS